MLSKLPPYYVHHVVEKRLNEMGSLQPMNIFLRQEVDRMQKVLKIVGSMLTDMRLAIDGTIIMNENLRDALDCIYDAKVPHSWEKVCSATLYSILDRVKFILEKVELKI